MSVDLMARMLKSSPATSVSRMLSGRRTVVRAKASSEMFSHCRLRSVRRVSRETKKRVSGYFSKSVNTLASKWSSWLWLAKASKGFSGFNSGSAPV